MDDLTITSRREVCREGEGEEGGEEGRRGGQKIGGKRIGRDGRRGKDWRIGGQEGMGEGGVSIATRRGSARQRARRRFASSGRRR